MHEAKTQLSGLVQDLRDGREQEIIISVSGGTCARLVPFERMKRVLGIDRGIVSLGPNFTVEDEEIERLFTVGDT